MAESLETRQAAYELELERIHSYTSTAPVERYIKALEAENATHRQERDNLRASISAVMPDEGECPWCSAGFEPCMCEMPWLLTRDDADAFFEQETGM